MYDESGLWPGVVYWNIRIIVEKEEKGHESSWKDTDNVLLAGQMENMFGHQLSWSVWAFIIGTFKEVVL